MVFGCKKCKKVFRKDSTYDKDFVYYPGNSMKQTSTVHIVIIISSLKLLLLKWLLVSKVIIV
jgi:hypothetical protein